MAHAFRNHKGTYVARLGETERAALTDLMDQVHSLLAPEGAQTSDPFETMMRRAGLTRLGDELPDSKPTGEDLDDPDRDPALDRLLPDAHRDDPLVAAEFRRISAPGLRARKAANLETAIGCLARPGGGRKGDELRLDEEEARAFAVALTDVRLVVGDRLGLRDDADSDRLDKALAQGTLDDQSAWLVTIYDFLTWLQESLTQAMLAGLAD